MSAHHMCFGVTHMHLIVTSSLSSVCRKHTTVLLIYFQKCRPKRKTGFAFVTSFVNRLQEFVTPGSGKLLPVVVNLPDVVISMAGQAMQGVHVRKRHEKESGPMIND